MDDARLTTLETIIAFQEKAIHDLSAVLHQQQQELDKLKTQVRRITERMAADEPPAPGEGMPAIERPPHY